MSRLLVPVLLFFGYTMVYAAVAHGGVFATDPWNGIFADAYTDIPNPVGGAASSGSTTATKQVGTPITNQATSAPNAGTPGGSPSSTAPGPRRQVRPINNPAGGIGGASNSNFAGGLIPGSLIGPAQFTGGGGLLGAPPNFEIQ